MHNSYSKLRGKFRLTALQLSAIFILPLFIFALIVKIKERQENESSTTKIVSTQNSQQQNNILQASSKTVNHSSEGLRNSDSAK